MVSPPPIARARWRCSIAPCSQAKAARDADDRLRHLGDAAERLYKLGEVDKARVLFAEGLRLANQMTDKKVYVRAAFAAQLSLVDSPAALAIAKELKGARFGGAMIVVYGIRHLLEPDPAECVRFWKAMRSVSEGSPGAMCWELAKVDSARARQLNRAAQIWRAAAPKCSCTWPSVRRTGMSPPRAGRWKKGCKASIGSCRRVLNGSSSEPGISCMSSNGSTRRGCPRSSGDTWPHVLRSRIRARTTTTIPRSS